MAQSSLQCCLTLFENICSFCSYNFRIISHSTLYMSTYKMKMGTETGYEDTSLLGKALKGSQQGRIQGGGGYGRPPPWAIWGGGACPPPPWIFRVGRERALSLPTPIERDTEKEGKRRLSFYEVMMAKETTPPPFPPIYISLSHCLPFCLNNILIRK